MSETLKKNSREYKLLKEKVIEMGEEGDQMKPQQFKMLHESFARFKQDSFRRQLINLRKLRSK
jgi:hypothetical protein